MKGLSLAWLARNAITVVVAVVALSCAGGVVYVSAQKGQGESVKVKAAMEDKAKAVAELEALQKKLSDLETDRNNVLTQTKLLLQDKSKYTELQDSYAELEEANKIFSQQKEKLHRLNAELEDGSARSKSQIALLSGELEDLKTQHAELNKIKDELKTALDQKVDQSPQFKQLQLDLKAAVSESGRLKTLNAELLEGLKTTQDRIGKVENRGDKYTKQMEDLKKKYDVLKAENEEFKKINKDLNKEVQQAPKKFKDMANENKTMKKEVSEMHYNLGVFYVDNKHFELARREFTRALVFNPNNPKTYYNLGYLYSEHSEEHEKAMAYFQKYLELDPHSKESGAVRAYILEREAYGDKMNPTQLPIGSPRLKNK